MLPMPRPRPPYLHRQVTQHGRVVWYVRVGKGTRIRIRAEYGTPEFLSAYKSGIRGERSMSTGVAKTGSLAWLMDRLIAIPQRGVIFR